MSKKTKNVWTKVPDNTVRHIWCWPDGTHEIDVDPSFYADSGTPVCGEGEFEGDDMHYVRTEVCGDHKSAETTLQRIFDILYFDSDRNCFNPDKEWDSAADFLDAVNTEMLALYGQPKDGSKKYPKMKPRV